MLKFKGILTVTTDTKNNSIMIVLVLLVLTISGWAVFHSAENREYRRALINLGESNCKRITRLEDLSYGYKDAGFKPIPCPKPEDFEK